MKVLLTCLVILFFEMIILMVLPKSHLVEIINKERQHTVTWFGENKTKTMIQDANIWFSSMFVETGMVDSSQKFFVRHRNQKYKKGWQEFSDASMWDQLVIVMQKVWLVVESGLLRLQIMWVCLLISLSFIFPSLIDGLMRREVCKPGEGNVSTNVYTATMFVFCSTFLLPLVLLFWPMAISPPYITIWTIILAGSLWLLASNLQHKV